MSISTLLIAAVVLLSNVHLVHVQDLSAQANANVEFNKSPAPPQNANYEKNVANREAAAFEEWRKSPMFLPTFEPDVISIPDVQREFVNNMVANDMELFRDILREAIDKRNTFAPSVSLMWKYTGKLLNTFIRNRKEEQRISPRKEPSPSFFELLASVAEQVINRSDQIKKERGYNKKTVNVDELYRRVDGVFNYIQRTINKSPVAAYLKWDQLIFFKGDMVNPDHDRELVELAGELTAQFRGMGYDKCIFVARRIINMLRMFSKGSIPSEKDV